MQNSPNLIKAKHLLSKVKGKPLSVEKRSKNAIELAGLLLSEARRIQTPAEKAMQEQLANMMNDANGKAFTTNMTDQCFRSQNPQRIADQLIYLLHKYGIPSFLPYIKKLQLKAFQWLGKPLANFLVPVVKSMLRQETRGLILPGEPDKLLKHMQQRRKEGVKINLNHLGEAILGEEEAEQRLNTYLTDLANPEIEYISIKISTIYSQLHLVGWENTLNALSFRLKKLYTAAKNHLYTLPNGDKVPKFINLDMEEYRDLHLTIEVFRSVLEEPDFFDFSAGIVLQAYLPDAFLMQQELTVWAMQRVAKGGAPIKIRIVKGANLAMEKVEASLRDWPQAPYEDKIDTDANFKRMVAYGCQPEHAKAVHLGIGSHNLFDIAYALLLRTEYSIESYVGFEMLEGMADHLRRVVQAVAGEILLYCPAATQEEFQHAIAYLVRRLDENTAPDNFLRHAFNMLPGSKEWQVQSALFSQACQAANTVNYSPRRQQNRLELPLRKSYSARFENEPDTDWSLAKNRLWSASLLKDLSKQHFDIIPLVIGEKEISQSSNYGVGKDPSFPEKEFYRYVLADNTHLDLALTTAVDGQMAWSATPLNERLLLLHEAAFQLRCHRGELIGAMLADTGKTIYEADVEISEAIDFAEYYRRNVEEMHHLEGITFSAKGPVLVAPPWNFPCSIPAGGILAALAAGNSVIFKPAPEAVLVGWCLVNILWKAGISKRALQFFNCEDNSIGSQLVKDKRLAAVILTGATNTAKYLMKLRPGLDLIAETGGKNAMIITAMADRDLAIKDVVQSAFGHAGQKCSACSLAILEAEVYDDPAFRFKLRDAVASLKVGSPWDPANRMNPLIHAPHPALMRGLTTLEEGEEWLLEAKCAANNPNLWSPGIKMGVQQGSFTHQTELFGPLLGIMRADNLAHAIDLANDTPYGLTSGIHTLDEREKQYWMAHIQAGNCYINRGITGAIVQRQPFGGLKASSFGPGAKAGGPNYLFQLMHAEQINLPTQKGNLNGVLKLLNQAVETYEVSAEMQHLWEASVGSYALFWEHYFSKPHDFSQVMGQDNVLYYNSQTQTLRIQHGDSDIDILRVIAAAILTNAELKLSLSDEHEPPLVKKFLQEEWRDQVKNITINIETEDDLIDNINSGQVERLRLLSPASQALQKVLADTACHAIIAPVLANGRIELLHFLREVSLSSDYHRYGNIEKFISYQ